MLALRFTQYLETEGWGGRLKKKCNAAFCLLISWSLLHTQIYLLPLSSSTGLCKHTVPSVFDGYHSISYKAKDSCWVASVGVFWVLAADSVIPNCQPAGCSINLLKSRSGQTLDLVFCTRGFILICLSCSLNRTTRLPLRCYFHCLRWISPKDHRVM